MDNSLGYAKLMLPPCNFRVKHHLKKIYILDIVRKKYILLTPEEWVRQHMLHYLINHLSYPKGFFRSERKINRNGHPGYYRTDIAVYDRLGRAKILVECKAAHIKLSRDALAQMMQYRRHLATDILVLTNGITHFCWKLETTDGRFKPIQQIPPYV